MVMTEQMFSCQPKPKIPSNDDSDAGLGVYLVKLALAHEDCQVQLSTVRNHLRVNGVIISEVPVVP